MARARDYSIYVAPLLGPRGARHKPSTGARIHLLHHVVVSTRRYAARTGNFVPQLSIRKEARVRIERRTRAHACRC